MSSDDGPVGGAPDDGPEVDLGRWGRELPQADAQALAAVARLAGRSGAREFQFSCQDPLAPFERRGWWATALYRGVKLIADGHASPGAACDALARQILDQGNCQGCGKVSFVADPQGYRVSEQTHQRVQREGICRWSRVAGRWERACGDLAPPDSSREKLAAAMAAAGVIPAEQIGAARLGRYDDYLAQTAFPQLLLLEELKPYGQAVQELRARVMAGDFDATRAEADAWAASPEGKATLAEFLAAGGPAGTDRSRQQRRRGRRQGKRRK